MIVHLSIKNIALIDDLELKFDHGLTSMTGETGAGKSIILEALQLLFGKRSDQDLIRHGENEAYVKGVFHVAPHVRQLFDLEETVIIERIMERTGKHTMKVNGQTTTLQYIKKLTSYIGSIHEQDDLYQLLNPNTYIDLVDQVDLDTIKKYHEPYVIALSKFHTQQNKLEDILKRKDHLLKEDDVARFQLNELKEAKLKLDELKELETELLSLKHFDDIMGTLQTIMTSFETSQSDQVLYDSMKKLDHLSTYHPNYFSLKEQLESAYYNVEDVLRELKDIMSSLDFDEATYQSIQERLSFLYHLEHKYHLTINELIQKQDELEQSIMMLDHYDDFIKQEETKLNTFKQEVLNHGEALFNVRNELAHTLEQHVIEVLKHLDLEHTQFKIALTKTDQFYEHGFESCEFLISLNEGEPIKTLSKVASGGERARFMLALKSILARQQHVSLLILDEIDVGVSGKTASKVATLMVELSKEFQVLVITHLPQVAAKANHQYLIKKAILNGRMKTSIELLENDARIMQIAYMLSDETLSTFAIEQAKTLLKK
jgi:DNA repair protein RecN (Recombination protein N)